MRKGLLSLGALALGFAAGFASLPASAQDPLLIEIPLDTVVFGDPGSEHPLAEAAVAPEDVGRQCTVEVQGINNESTHPNSDVLVRSGISEVIASDVERAPNVVTQATGTLVLGDVVSVFVRLGPDGVFSAGMTVTVVCAPLPTTTTSTSQPTTTTSTTAPTGGDEGCTPGFWKNHPEAWVSFTPGQTLESVFDVPNVLGLDGASLEEALSFGGGSGTEGGARILLRAAVAALLNAASPTVDFPLTTAEVINQVNAALASLDRSTMLTLASTLDANNNLGCPSGASS